MKRENECLQRVDAEDSSNGFLTNPADLKRTDLRPISVLWVRRRLANCHGHLAGLTITRLKSQGS